MIVRLLTALAGRDQSWSAGALYECGPDGARRLIEAGIAEPVEVQQSARVDPGERAVRPRAMPRATE